MARNVIPMYGKQNIVDIDIPIAGRDKPIRLSVPKLAWMPPKHVKAYNEWVKDLLALEQKYLDWSAADPKTRGEAPCDEADVNGGTRVLILRWLKPYLSDKEYAAVLDEVPQAGAQWIFDLLQGKDPEVDKPDIADDGDVEIESGESEASALS